MPAILLAILATEPPDPYPHPTLAEPAAWPGVVLIVMLLAFFVTAALLGPIVRATMRDESTRSTPGRRPPAAPNRHGGGPT